MTARRTSSARTAHHSSSLNASSLWGRLLLNPERAARFTSYSMLDIWHMHDLPVPAATLVHTNTSALEPQPADVRRAESEAPKFHRVLDLHGPALILETGVVLTSRPPAVVDASGGILRKVHPYQHRRPAPLASLPAMHQYGTPVSYTHLTLPTICSV